ncbi:MAG: transcription termination factor NusA [Deltaproteobacteria bacterium]|nr:MAG: transcription termination factor NusA [Deltaproteobacteria bacterium]
MKADLSQIINYLGKEKGIKREVIIDAIREALIHAAKKRYGVDHEFEVEFDEETSEFQVLKMIEVVDEVRDPEFEMSIDEAREYDPDAQVGDLLGFQIKTEELGRIAAQTAKQIIFQKIRDAEREVIYEEFKDKKGDIVNGIVQRVEREYMIIDLGRTEAIMPYREQVKKERYRQGDRLRAYVKDVQLTQRGPEIILSRTDPRFVMKLFEMEVPEIYEGIVSIVSIAREPGSRTKVAVKSRDKDVDPVGACVGLRGTRVQKVVEELKGEKIDIVQWDEDPAKFACNALSPAEIIRVLVNESEKTMEVIVPPDQLQIAIGRRGQNVKLASKLIGWEINVREEGRAEEALKMAEALFSGIKKSSDAPDEEAPAEESEVAETEPSTEEASQGEEHLNTQDETAEVEETGEPSETLEAEGESREEALASAETEEVLQPEETEESSSEGGEEGEGDAPAETSQTEEGGETEKEEG